MKLHLICHGMMLFWYKKPVNGQDEGYTILIPKAYQEKKPMHDLRFGVGPGVPNPHPLLRLANPEPEGEAAETKSYKLAFGVQPNQVQQRPSPDPLQNLSLYEGRDHRPVLNTAGIAYAIDVPYPHAQAAMRIATYEADPYEHGPNLDNAAKHLDIRPRRIVGARLLTFLIDDPAISIRLEDGMGDISTVVRAPLTGDVKLHLYSQPTEWPGAHEDHTKFLNGMIDLEHKTTGARSPLDLKLNADRKATLDPDTIDMVGNLTFRDHLHLWEYNAMYLRDSTHDQHGSGAGHARFLYIDPAECGQGGGC